MKTIEKRIHISASAKTIFKIYEDVAHWNAWDPDTLHSTLSNGLMMGSRGSLTPKVGRTIPIRVISVKYGSHFTLVSKTPIFKLVFFHELLPDDTGTTAIHRVGFSGLIGPLLKLTVGRRVDIGLPDTLSRLKAAAESRENGAIRQNSLSLDYESELSRIC